MKHTTAKKRWIQRLEKLEGEDYNNLYYFESQVDSKIKNYLKQRDLGINTEADFSFSF